MRPFFLALVAVGGFVPGVPLHASEAVFSPDGRFVTMGYAGETMGLVRIDIQTGKVVGIPLPEALAGREVESVASGSDGEVLFLAADAVWVLRNPDAPVIERVCTTAPVVMARDLFVATGDASPVKDVLFVSGIDAGGGSDAPSFWARRPGGKVFQSVTSRRAGWLQAGTPTSNGRLFFACSGDLWEGGITPEDDGVTDIFGVLTAARIAPIGALSTDMANSGSQSVQSIAVSGNWIYCTLGGRHCATLLRVPLPDHCFYGPDSDDLPTVGKHLEVMSAALKGAEVIAADLEFVEGLCATEVDGETRVFYGTPASDETGGTTLMLWRGKGEPRVVGRLPGSP